MSKNSSITLVKVITDLALFLEFAGEEQVNPDIAVEMMEQMAVELQSLNDDDRSEVVQLFKDISRKYTGDRYEFVKELPDSFGLT